MLPTQKKYLNRSVGCKNIVISPWGLSHTSKLALKMILNPVASFPKVWIGAEQPWRADYYMCVGQYLGSPIKWLHWQSVQDGPGDCLLILNVLYSSVDSGNGGHNMFCATPPSAAKYVQEKGGRLHVFSLFVKNMSVIVVKIHCLNLRRTSTYTLRVIQITGFWKKKKRSWKWIRLRDYLSKGSV